MTTLFEMASFDARPIMVIRSLQRLGLAKIPMVPCDDICMLIIQEMPSVQKNSRVALRLLQWWNQRITPHCATVRPYIRDRWEKLARLMCAIEADRLVRCIHAKVLKRYKASLKMVARRADDLHRLCVANNHCKHVRSERQPHERVTRWCKRCRRQILNTDSCLTSTGRQDRKKRNHNNRVSSNEPNSDMDM